MCIYLDIYKQTVRPVITQFQFGFNIIITKYPIIDIDIKYVSTGDRSGIHKTQQLTEVVGTKVTRALTSSTTSVIVCARSVQLYSVKSKPASI